MKVVIDESAKKLATYTSRLHLSLPGHIVYYSLLEVDLYPIMLGAVPLQVFLAFTGPQPAKNVSTRYVL